MYKAILFDMDGTLLNSVPCIISSWQYILKKYLPQSHFSVSQILSFIGRPLKDQLLELVKDEEVAEQMLLCYRKDNIPKLQQVDFFHGVLPLLTRLKSMGKSIGIVTSKNKRSLHVTLEKLQLADFFDVLISCDDTQEHKPNPAPLLRAAEVLTVDPSECLYVGDARFDVQCANAAGMDSFAVSWGAHCQEDLALDNPTHLASSLNLHEFLAVIATKQGYD